ncbi:MAG: carboxypeptidase M32 [Leptospiraceae bacterium]|nr:carboxypeptidase M32 [Leptospiraceae bacterium]
MNTENYRKYRKFWEELNHYYNILNLLHWDSEVFMPEAAREERSGQISLVSGHCHKLFTGDYFDEIIGKLEIDVSELGDPQEKFIRTRELEVLKKDRERSKKLSLEFVEEFSKITNLAYGIWGEAKKESDFSKFAPTLQKIVDMSKEKAEAYGYEKERYDALLEDYETDTTSEFLQDLFVKLKNSLIPIINQAKSYDSPFKKSIAQDLQNTFNQKLPALLGLPPEASRLDISLHPFSTGMGAKDKRITTRYDEKDPMSSIFGVLHETGHALYEYGLGKMNDYYSPLTSALSYGMHESQSRLWENQVGRSRPFWEYFYPTLQKDFNIYQYDMNFDNFYNFINTVNKSKIRVEADQVTYNLHIILRFEIERELISGDLKVNDLPELWNTKMKEYFDLTIENDAEGVLQDVHWSGGAFGYFPTYTLGNIYSAQLFNAFFNTHQNFWDDVSSRGDFSSLVKWLDKKVHSQGRIYSPSDLIKHATGHEPDSQHLVKYLKNKVREQE